MTTVNTTTADESFRRSSKEVATFIAAAAFATACAETFHSVPGRTFLPGTLPWTEWALFALCILLNLRYYYGNVRYLDSLAPIPPGAPWAKTRIASDLFVIICQSLLLLITAFFLRDPAGFAVVFLIALSLESIWYITQRAIVKHPGTQPGEAVLRLRRMELAQYLGFTTVVAILLLFLFKLVDDPSPSVFDTIIVSILVVNYLLDLRVNGRFYFGGEEVDATPT